jgi:protein TonB
MVAHSDIIEYREPLGRALTGSVLFHVAVFAFLLGHAWWEGRGKERFGSPNAGGGATLITPVSQINLPSSGGIPNPVATDTESRVPLPPKEAKESKRQPAEDPDAVAIKGKKLARRQSDVAASAQRFRPKGADRPNQAYSSTGQALSSPMYGSTSGGGVGIGTGGTLGTRFGWYSALVREKVSRAWQPPGADPRQRTSQPAIVLFDIMRDGSVRNVRLFQRSGNYALDVSAERAVWSAAPFPPLPPGYERSSASVELWFTLER